MRLAPCWSHLGKLQTAICKLQKAIPWWVVEGKKSAGAMARDEPSLDPSRLAPLRLVNHAKDHPTFAQAVATKSEISSWSLESLQSLQADLFKMSTEASKRMKKLQEMQQYLTDVAAGREPAAPTESSPVSSPAQAGETAGTAGEPRLMANMANDDSDVDMTDTKSAYAPL